LHLIIVRKIKIKQVTFLNKYNAYTLFSYLEFNHECGYDEPLFDLTLNHHIECDTIERCPLNSYCNKQTNRCCVKGRITKGKVRIE